MEIPKSLLELIPQADPLITKILVTVVFLCWIFSYIISFRHKIRIKLLLHKRKYDEISFKDLDEDSKELINDRNGAKLFLKELGVYAEKKYRTEICRYLKASDSINSSDISLVRGYLKFKNGMINVLIGNVDKYSYYFNMIISVSLFLFILILYFLLVYSKPSIATLIFFLITSAFLSPLIHSLMKEVFRYRRAIAVSEDLEKFYKEND